MLKPSLRAALVVMCMAAASAWSSAAGAAVIYDNGVTTLNNGAASDPSTPQFAAEDFQLLTGATTITGARWTGLYLSGNTPGAPDIFTLRIYADNGGAPAVAPLFNVALGAVPRADTGADLNIANIFIFDIYGYEASFGPVSLSANTTYWLSIYNDTAADPNSDWVWTGDGSTPGHLFSPNQSTWLQASAGALDFELIGPDAVPEPGTLVLFAGGLLLAAALRRAPSA
jgi:hypothetical protein